jgi:hypothetical protein
MISVNLVRLSDSEVVATIETSAGASALTGTELDVIVAEHCPNISVPYRSAWISDFIILSTSDDVPKYKLVNG